MANNAVADLVGVLSQHRLLGPEQLNEVKNLQRRIADPKAIFKELVPRGWLSNFQANKIQQGRAADLVLGSYLILDLLGEGGAGQVFKAKHMGMNRITALKVLRKEMSADQEIVGRF